tara:strand:- start:1695 stop:2003 length:309 start_codon:yes stop_codon:yes gene_type:complete
MATPKNLVTCVECGHETYKKAAKCNKCGSPINPKFGFFWITSPYTSKTSKAFRWAGTALIVLVLLVLLDPLIQGFAEDTTISFMEVMGSEEGEALAKKMYKE